MNLCARHREALVTALELRGLLRPALGLAPEAFDPLACAREAIVSHATHFAGRAAVRMLTQKLCPICFVNAAIAKDGRNPGLTVDGWVDNAADEAETAAVAHGDRETTTPLVIG